MTTSDETLCDEIAQLCGWAPEYFERSRRLRAWVRGEEEMQSVPRYDVDPGAALGLLAYVCQQRYKDLHPVKVTRIARDDCELWSVQISAGSDWWNGSGDTPEEAIARSCRDALVAIREQETKTP